MRKLKNTALAATAFVAMGAAAAVKLPAYIGDNMVLQQNTAITIPGKATPGAKVTASPSWGNAVTAKADADGNFTVKLPTPAAGGPFSITFDDGDAITIGNILAGEVWLCSGQSNMEFPVSGWTNVMDAERVIATANHPDIRLLQVHKNISTAPLDDVTFNGGGWMECNSASIPEFSAVAYFYACELARELGVPVGVIDSTWGGTPAEAWTPYEYVKAVPGFEADAADLEAAGGDAEKMKQIYEAKRDAWMKRVTADKRDASMTEFNGGKADWGAMPVPANWETTVLPGFDGVVWLQHTLDVPAAWAGKEIALHLGAIDDQDLTYFNGEKVGEGYGYNVHRTYTVPANLVKEGKSVITIVITDTGGEGGITGNVSDIYAECMGQREALAGEWAYMVAADFNKYGPQPRSIYSSSYPTVLYNAMINPLRNLPIKGCIWYQGCANVGADEQYAKLVPQMVRGWREKFNNPGMPFYFVQLAGFLAPNYCQPESQWAALRNAQTSVLDLDNTGMAVAIDLGNPVDIHPKDKQNVAHRLAILARNKTYGQDVACEAPRCVGSKVSGNKMVLTFDGDVHSTTAAALGFMLGDKSGLWQQATASVGKDGRTVTLTAPAIKKPVAARYNWADYPNGNLYSCDNLPVAPFATDK